jgi:transposase InsO family protein
MLRNWIKEHHKAVGWSMSSRMQAQLVCDALTTAIWQRRPEAGLSHHVGSPCSKMPGRRFGPY